MRRPRSVPQDKSVGKSAVASDHAIAMHGLARRVTVAAAPDERDIRISIPLARAPREEGAT